MNRFQHLLQIQHLLSTLASFAIRQVEPAVRPYGLDRDVRHVLPRAVRQGPPT